MITETNIPSNIKGQKVVITIDKTDAKYAGDVDWIDFKNKKVKLSTLWILNKNYQMKVASKSNTQRIFNTDKISRIEPFNDVEHLVKWKEI
jgi:hypothetical protein